MHFSFIYHNKYSRRLAIAEALWYSLRDDPRFIKALNTYLPKMSK